MTQASAAYRFHDVPVELSGDTELVAPFETVLATDAVFSTAPIESARVVRISLSSESAERASPDAFCVREVAPGFMRVEQAGVVAHVDLNALHVTVRGCSVVPNAAQARVLVSGLLLALRELGIIRLHAAAVVNEDVALVLVGDSGAGKTTTALALLEAGSAPLTDDQLFVRDRGGKWELLTAPQAFRVKPDTLDAFGSLAGARGALLPELGKYELAIHLAHASSQLDHFRGRVRLLFPRRTSAHGVRVAPIAEAEALGELMVASPAVALGGAARTRAHALLLRNLARTAQPARLELGPELLEQPEATGWNILSLLARAP